MVRQLELTRYGLQITIIISVAQSNMNKCKITATEIGQLIGRPLKSFNQNIQVKR